MSQTISESAAPGPVVSVSVHVKGQRNRMAQVNKSDLDDLLWEGFSSQWFLGNRGDNILVHTHEGKVVPVCALIMKTPKGYQVGFKDGDPFNLTRDNMVLEPKYRNPSQDLDTTQVMIDEDDLQGLQDRGIAGPWFIGGRGDVLTRNEAGYPVPVAVLITKCPKGLRVVFKDGNPLNLTRDNLALGPRPLTDLLPIRPLR